MHRVTPYLSCLTRVAENEVAKRLEVVLVKSGAGGGEGKDV